MPDTNEVAVYRQSSTYLTLSHKHITSESPESGEYSTLLTSRSLRRTDPSSRGVLSPASVRARVCVTEYHQVQQ